MYILGISAFYHDSAACILYNGKIIAAAQEERFTRKKHDPSLPVNAIKYCLNECNINISDIKFISYYENSTKKFSRIFKTRVHLYNILMLYIYQNFSFNNYSFYIFLF